MTAVVHRRVTLSLGCGQLLSFSSTIYLVAPLASPIASALAIPSQTVFAAFSAALAIAALTGPWFGLAVDRHGGHIVLTGASLLFAVGLFALGRARDAVDLFAGWAVIGVAMDAGLYEGAFATLVRLAGPEARPAISAVTLIASVASTGSWLLSTWLVHRCGWRYTCLAWAGMQLALGVPLHAMLPDRRTDVSRVDVGKYWPATDDESGTHPLPGASWRACAALSTSFAATAFTGAAMAAHLPRLLSAAGAGPATIWLSASIVGPAQLLVRALDLGVARRASPLGLARVTAALQPLGALLLGFFGAVAAPGFAFLHGAGNGPVDHRSRDATARDLRACRLWASPGLAVGPSAGQPGIGAMAFRAVPRPVEGRVGAIGDGRVAGIRGRLHPAWRACCSAQALKKRAAHHGSVTFRSGQLLRPWLPRRLDLLCRRLYRTAFRTQAGRDHEAAAHGRTADATRVRIAGADATSIAA
jgi:MFS family permease